MQYWLMKSEPETFSIDDLASKPNQTSCWDGVRNYQARNFMRDDMKKKDKVFFYHSNCKPPAIVGVAEVIREGYVEIDNWYMVDIKLVKKFNKAITLAELRNNKKLNEMLILRPGNRLSITPVTSKDWFEILRMEENND